MSDDGPGESEDEASIQNLESSLPTLEDPDFAQFVKYLGADCTSNLNSIECASEDKYEDTTENGSCTASKENSSKGTESTRAVDSTSDQETQFESSGSRTGPNQHIQNILIKIVQEAYVAPLPPGWNEFTDSEGRIYFYNFVTESSSWAHPTDRTYKELIQIIKKVLTARLERAKIMQVIETHLQSVHARALEALQGFSGPYVSEEGHQYYYNEITGVSTWESPILEWEHNISTRYHVLWSGLIENFDSPEQHASNDGGQSGPLSKLQLPLHLLSRAPVAENPDNIYKSDSANLMPVDPPTPSTARSFLTARSFGSMPTARASARDSNLNSTRPNSPGSRQNSNTNPNGKMQVMSGNVPTPPSQSDDDSTDHFNFTFGPENGDKCILGDT